MTENKARSRMHNLCTNYAQTMRMILCAGFAVFLSGGAHANGWQEFEARCLAPFEDVKPAITAGLAEGQNIPDWLELTGTERGYGREGGRFVLIADDDKKVSFANCGLIDLEPHDEIQKDVTGWINAAIEAGKYIKTDDETDYDLSLQSTQWREPRLEIYIIQRANTTIYVVTEVGFEA